MTTKKIYKNDRPHLTVTHLGGEGLGRCYNRSDYEVISRVPLSLEDFKNLWAARVIGFGQEWNVKQVVGDRRVELPESNDGLWGSREPAPSGHDEVRYCEVNTKTGTVVDYIVNPETGKPYEPTLQPYYTYHVQSFVDSSD